MMDMLNNFTLITFFFDVVIKSFFLLSLSVLLLRFIPATFSKLRYGILLLTFASLMILPVQSFLPNAKISLFAFQKNIPQRTQPAYLKVMDPDFAKEKPLINLPLQQNRPSIIGPSSPPSYLLFWPKAMVATWFLIALTLFLKNILDMIYWRRYVLTYQTTASYDWENIKTEVANELKLKKYPPLILSEAISSPLTYGWRSPVVALPTIATQWPPHRIKMVLLHEGIHIKRGDYFFNNLINITLAIYWFNPMTWILSQKIRLECERSCDEKVVDRGITRTAYASELLAIAGQFIAPASPKKKTKGLTLAHPSLLQQRFQTLLFPSVASFRAGTGFKVCMLTVVLLFTFLQFQTPLPFFLSAEKQLIKQIQKQNGVNNYTQQLLLTLVERDAKNSSHAIMPLLSDKDPAVRAMAAWSLGQLKSNEAIYSLTSHISDSNEDVKEYVLLSLGEFGYSDTFYSISPLLDHQNPDIRKAALWALSQIGCLPAFHQISLYLNDANPAVRQLARFLIDHWDREKLFSWMSAFLKLPNVPSLCTESLEGVIRLNQVDELVHCLIPDNQDLQKQLKSILSFSEHDHRMDQLKEMFAEL